jgi:predicted permease
MYGLVAGILSPLPVAEPHEVVDVSLLDTARGASVPISSGLFSEWARSATTFERLGAYLSDEASVSGEGASPQRYQAAYVTSGVFELLGVQPIRGRLFRAEDDRSGSAPMAVIREDVWQERFNRSPEAIGSPLRINGVHHTIIGIAPLTFGFPATQRLWMSLPVTGAPRDRAVGVVGRLRDEVGAQAAAAELRRLQPDPAPAVRVVEYVHSRGGAEAERLARYLYIVVAFLVSIAALNVAGLLLARGSARVSDVALRLALGGGRLRVMGHMLAEALILAAGGTVLGLALTAVALDWIEATLEGRGALRYWARIEVHEPLVVFAIGLTALAGAIAGLLPAIRTTRVDLSQAVKPGNAFVKGGLGRMLPVLVGVEVALSCALLLMSSLVVRGAVASTQLVETFPQRDVLTARIVLEDYDYPDAPARVKFRNQLARRLAANPEVRDFTFTTTLPGDGAPTAPFRLATTAAENERSLPRVQQRRVLPGFFSMFGLQVIDGRPFSELELQEDRPVAVVNDAFAREQIPGTSAVGQRVRLGTGSGRDVEIIGVVVDPGVTVDDGRPAPSIFLPMSEGTPEAVMIALRTRAATGDALGVLVREIRAVDPLLPLGRVSTLAEVISREHDGSRIFGLLFASFGIASLMLAAVGLHGLIAFTVAKRRRDIGIMRALGATTRNLLTATLARSLAPVAVGVTFGVGAALLLAPLFGEGLFGANPHDPIVFVAVPVGLSTVAAVAAFGPARRALRIDPADALRVE